MQTLNNIVQYQQNFSVSKILSEVKENSLSLSTICDDDLQPQFRSIIELWTLHSRHVRGNCEIRIYLYARFVRNLDGGNTKNNFAIFMRNFP